MWVFAQGVYPDYEVSGKVLAPDGTVTWAAKDKIAGVTIIDVPSLDEALQWASKLAAVLRCSQEVREFAPVPTEEADRAYQPSAGASVPE